MSTLFLFRHTPNHHNPILFSIVPILQILIYKLQNLLLIPISQLSRYSAMASFTYDVNFLCYKKSYLFIWTQLFMSNNCFLDRWLKVHLRINIQMRWKNFLIHSYFISFTFKESEKGLFVPFKWLFEIALLGYAVCTMMIKL